EEHRAEGGAQPGDPEGGMARMGTGDQGVARLEEDVDREREEGAADQAESPALAPPVDPLEFPDDDEGGEDLDQGIETETRQGHRARADRSRDHDDGAD